MMSERIQETFPIDHISELQISSTVMNHMTGYSSYPMISLPFPPNIEPRELIVNKKPPQDSPNGKQIRAPNAFIIYRKAYVKAARDQGYILPMTVISTMASASWDQESEKVKEEYKRIAKDTHKLLKETFPKKSNQRKRKEKWNFVSFQNESLNNENNENNENSHNNDDKGSPEFESVIVSAEESDNANNMMHNTQNLSLLSPLTPIFTTSSSPNLSEFDSNVSIISEDNSYMSNTGDDNYDNHDNLPTFQEYQYPEYQEYFIYSPENWLNPSELTLEEPFDPSYTSIDDSNGDNNHSTLNMTIAEAINIINSNNFDQVFKYTTRSH